MSTAGLGWWPPFTGWQAGASSDLHESLLAISNEWQAFVQRRVGEDLHTLQQFGAATSPVQTWSVWAAFWQKAAEDYAREYAVIGKLAADCVRCSIAAANETTRNEPEAAEPPLSKAA